MVMFKAKFKPTAGGGDKPSAREKPRAAQQQQQPQPGRPPQEPEAPPIEKERGPQYPVKEPGPGNPPERVRAVVA
ncbi:MAG TPA: hypothetical protein VNB23_01275 [Ramlibacter sp.]|nr:hypothetical protein [Ramlibacter sp.]